MFMVECMFMYMNTLFQVSTSAEGTMAGGEQPLRWRWDNKKKTGILNPKSVS